MDLAATLTRNRKRLGNFWLTRVADNLDANLPRIKATGPILLPDFSLAYYVYDFENDGRLFDIVISPDGSTISEHRINEQPTLHTVPADYDEEADKVECVARLGRARSAYNRRAEEGENLGWTGN